MAIVPQVLRLALNDELNGYGTNEEHSKLTAIKLVRAEGYVTRFDGQFNGVKLEVEPFGSVCLCNRQPLRDRPLTEGHVWVQTPNEAGPPSYPLCTLHPLGVHHHCPDGCLTTHPLVGLKDAKDYVEALVERYLDALDPGQRVAELKAQASRLTDAVREAERETRSLRVDLEDLRHDYEEAERRRQRFEARLLEESTASRVTERRLGKALSQVTGLKAKVADRDYKLGWMASQNKSLLQQVRRLNGAIAQDFVRRAMETGLYDGD